MSSRPARSTRRRSSRASAGLASQTAYAYQSGAQQQAVWEKVGRPRLLRCAATLAHGSADGVKFKVTGMHLLRLPGLAAKAAGYRVTGTAATTNQTIDVFLDALLLPATGRS